MVYSYEFDKGAFLARLTKTLQEEGYVFSSPSVVAGKSVVEHTFDIHVQGGISQESIFVDIASSPSGVDELAVLKCFAKTIDTSPAKTVLVAHPALNESASRLAREYRIPVIEARDAEEACRALSAALKMIKGKGTDDRDNRHLGSTVSENYVRYGP